MVAYEVVVRERRKAAAATVGEGDPEREKKAGKRKKDTK
jgi:hypothetical protein